MYSRLKKRTREILEVAAPGDFASRVFDIFITTLILVSVFIVVFETVEGLPGQYFFGFEIFIVAIFSVEYILRIWSCNVDERYKGRIKGRMRYVITPLALLDLLAIAPFYLPAIIKIDLRMLRLFRLFRLLKLTRYSSSMQTLGNVIKAKKEELIVTMAGVMTLLIVAASLMYYAENETQPEIYGSIPAAMWWGVATLTTVGYGDAYPVTLLGKILAGVVAILGIGMFALPAGILGSGFLEEMQKKKNPAKKCPHCGEKLD
ncbi:MAG: ion transporter [Actinobacteria bacterium]|nr:ion transporter [Actinomycetota bacterium]